MTIEEITGKKDNIGIVEQQFYTFDGIDMDCGEFFGPITVAYETYGTLNEDKSNAILVCHALTGDEHLAGFHQEDIDEIIAEQDPKQKDRLIRRRIGWWDDMIGPGKPFDTNKYFVIGSNVLTGCHGTTGPSSIDPKTGKPYGLRFPITTMCDMVRVQKKLCEYLGVEKLFAVAGGSYGGMHVLDWTVHYPDCVNLAIIIASTAQVSPQAMAFDEISRRAIMNDPYFNNGDYYDQEKKPDYGTETARMIGHMQYLSPEAMVNKFGKRLHKKDNPDYDWNATEYSVESYLNYQGQIFTERKFDANSYLYITKAMDYYDATHIFSSERDMNAEENAVALAKAFKETKAKYLCISFSTDWLFPTKEVKKFVSSLRKAGKDVAYTEIQTDKGHDAFLLEFDILSKLVRNNIEKNGDI